MKLPLKNTIVALTISAFTISTVGCTTCRQVPITTAQDVQTITFEPEKSYEIEFTTGQRYNVKGNNLALQDNLIGIRFQEEESFHYYQREQFNSICAEEKSKGKTTAAIIGGIAGGLALTLGLILGIGLASWKENE